MFYAMGFIKTEYGYAVRNLKVGGFKSLQAAQSRIIKVGMEGYVKKLGSKQPVWASVKGI